MNYEAKTFTFPELDGISKKTMDEHMGLYQGYVKNFNAISALLPEYAKDSEKNAHALSELLRRRSFEFGGMRLHELYFPQLEGGATPINTGSAFAKQVEKEYHSAENLLPYLKAIGNMRGPGWAILYWDPEAKQFLAGFSGEQHQGHFVTLPIILALDVWEHSFILDYGAQGKGKYIDAFFKNLNWGVVEERFEEAVR
jgi:Fe-Mn family superoxide dismutase